MTAMRQSGIDVLGDVSWGSHFCLFYETGQDLIDILVPYFKAGLERNEFCMWITSEPLHVKQARLALAEALPDLDQRIARGQIEILDYGDWYTRSGKFRSEEVLQGWVDKLNHARLAGFEGLRLTGNTFWLEKSDWRDFTDYEAAVDGVIGRYPMMACCTYSLSKYGAAEIVDVMSNHESALIKQNGQWRTVQRAHHKAVEQALRKSEERFRGLFVTMTEGLAIHEMIYADGKAVDYVITEVNPAYECITGLVRSSAEGKKASELYGMGRPPYLDVYARVASSGAPECFETYFPPMDKHFTVSVFSPEKGKFATAFSDITGRKKAEAKQTRENRILTLFTGMLEWFVQETGSVVYDKVLDVLLAGTGSRHGVFGYIDETGDLVCPTMSRMFDNCEIKGKCIRYSKDQWKGLWGRAMKKQKTLYSNKSPAVPPGHVPINNNLAAPILFQGRAIGLINLANREAGYTEEDREVVDAVAHQIAPVLYAWIQKETLEKDRQRAEKALLESAQRLSRAQEMAHLGSWELDLTVNRLTWSDEVYRIFGLQPGEFGATYEAFLDRIHPDDRAAVDAAYTESIRKGKDAYEIEHRVVRKDTGEIRFVHERCRNLRGAEGRFIRSEGMIHDITERKTAEMALRRSHEALEQRVQERTAELVQAQKMDAVGLLAGGIAHDFNNMMQVVTGYAHRTLMDLSSDDPLRKNIERMKEAGESASALTHQLLAFSKKQILRLITLDLNVVIVTMEEMLRRTLGDDVILNTRLQANLHSIKGDPVRLQQVLVNLALNARDAMDKGGTLTIETADVTLGETHPYGEGSVPAGPYVMLAVSDTGCGMDKETQARVFDPFYTTKPQGKGTGLGLSMVYGTVQQSGGIIRIYSVPGEGATFKIYFPQTVVSAVDRTPPPAPLSARGGRETLLLVEDNDKVREFTVRELANLGYRVLEARNERGALLAAESNDGPIHLLITDVILPGKSGRDVSESLSAKHAGIMTLYISGYTEDHIVERGILLPTIHFLPKPFTIIQLDAKIRELLGSSSQDEKRIKNRRSLKRTAGSNPGPRMGVSAPRILVVDDVPGVADSIAYILSKVGYEVKAAMDGATALDLAGKMEPDAVLLDIELPDISGYELARRLRQSGSKRPPFIIVTSGHSLQRHTESADAVEVDEYLEKPLDFNKLKAILAAKLGTTQTGR